MTLQAQLDEALRLVQSRSDLVPKIGLVCGSGLSGLTDSLTRARSIPFAEIPHYPTNSVAGQGAQLTLGLWRGVALVAAEGRAHLYEGHPPQAVGFPIRLLARLGVRTLVLTNAAGAVNANYRAGDVMIIEDHLNLTGFNPLVGPHEEWMGERFVDLSEAYDAGLRSLAEKACWKVGVTARKGIYAAFCGPSYETPAEVRMARALGADAVGMSTVLETIVARQMGLKVLGLSCLTNPAAGLTKRPLRHEEVLSVGAQSRAALTDILDVVMAELAKGQ